MGRRSERLGGLGSRSWTTCPPPDRFVATLAAARQGASGALTVAVFQPHLYSRTAMYAEAMGVALAAADLAIVADVYGGPRSAGAGRDRPAGGRCGAAPWGRRSDISRCGPTWAAPCWTRSGAGTWC
ncbi:MAG: hypothetical protein R2882_05610 [Gemmatimonadales bacterium]